MPPNDPSVSPGSVDRWREAVLTAGVAVFDWDVRAKRIYRSPEMLAICREKAAAGDIASDSSLMIGTDGMPIISTREEHHGDLVVMHCTNAWCVPNAHRR